MGTLVDQVVCPKCGKHRLFINTDDYRPLTIRCTSLKKCGWTVDLKQFWPKKEAS
jgi:endogenous inhibitor of DNA gyrase (YacG/DUF329 family)